MVAGGALIDTRSHLSPYELRRYFLFASYEKAMTKSEDIPLSVTFLFNETMKFSLLITIKLT